MTKEDILSIIKGKQNKIKTLNGHQLRGKLVSKVKPSDSPTQIYDLSSATKIVLSMPQSEPTEPKQGTKKNWKLHISKPVELAHLVSVPRFYFSYPSNCTLNPGGFYSMTYGCPAYEMSQSFYVKVKDEEIQANLGDFEKISFMPPKQQKSKEGITIKLMAGGVETHGAPIIKTEAGDLADSWLLMTDLADNPGITIMLTNPTCSLIKVSK